MKLFPNNAIFPHKKGNIDGLSGNRSNSCRQIWPKELFLRILYKQSDIVYLRDLT